MVSYLYRASYTASKYASSASLLHARVAIIADKYACASLYGLAKDLLASCINAAAIDDWVAIAALVYAYTTSDLPVHVELRDLVIVAAVCQPESFLRNESVEELLRSNADLATDLLQSRVQGVKARDLGEHIFMCDHCYYVHAGSPNCSNVELSLNNKCPKCMESAGSTFKRHVHKVGSFQGVSCSECNGVHTVSTRGYKLDYRY